MIRTTYWAVMGMTALVLAGCGKQQEAAQSPLESIPTVADSSATAMDQMAAQAAPLAESIPATAGEMGGPIEIQTALANAGYYSGPIDGKVGPMTQQAIQEFQRASGLNADGKVGPKTWAALKPYLSSQQPATSTQ